MTMTPAAFITKWKASQLGEDKNGGAARQHFLDLCELLGVPKPAEADPKGEWFSFEKGTSKTTGTRGWADVWMRDHFGWEYKGPGGDLTKAYAQLQQYAVALENPPLLIVSDTRRIIIHTNWTNTVSEVTTLELDDLADPNKLNILRWAFTDPERLRPSKTIQAVTDEAAEKFAELALRLRQRGHEAERVAHFVNRLAFCMFAEDVNLLPKGFFTQRLYTLVNHKERAQAALKSLFSAMNTGGMYGDEPIAWFNGGLFDSDDILPLEQEDIALLYSAAEMDWQDIDPSIFGTLFERGLDPDKRSQLGAHYTDAEKIEMIIDPVIRQPLLREWEAVLAQMDAELGKESKARTGKGAKEAAAKSFQRIQNLVGGFLGRLEQYRVLDPACGSGNFLYLALKTLKDIEQKVYLESERFDMPIPKLMVTGPHNMLGIEINPYAAELARMTVWIGEIQWCMQHGWSIHREPILRSLKTIQCHDALLDGDKEFAWPQADAIVGNPPFLGDKKMVTELGEEYVLGKLRPTFKKRLPGQADFVCYWFEKAHQQIKQKKAERVGLVSTNSISGGKNREVLKVITESQSIYSAWSDEPWMVEGAAVRVALVCFARSGLEQAITLNGQPVEEIYADLTARSQQGGLDLSKARLLPENKGIAFIGTQKNGPFTIPGEVARQWLKLPTNPNGRPNADVIRPWANGMDITRRSSDTWIIDFGTTMTEQEASLYEVPFEHVLKKVKPTRVTVRRQNHREYWWRYGESRPGLRQAVSNLDRFIVTSMVSSHRFFVWLSKIRLPENLCVVITRSDDITFGILHSRFHEAWALRMGTFLGVGNDPRYTPSTTFETFPFPPGLEPNLKPTAYKNPQAESIGAAAKRLNDLREAWLNPPDLVKRVPEVVPGYPDRIVPISDEAAATLKQRTLTKLYNTKPQWLQDAHRALDEAVAAAYGWPADISTDDALKNMLKMNLQPNPKT